MNKDKVWEFIKNNSKTIAIVVVLLVVVVGGAFAFRSYFPEGIIQSLINDQVATIKQQYEQDLAAKDNEIAAAKSSLKKSQAQVAKLNVQIKDLKGRIDNVQAPTTTQETKDRLRALGYTPSR
jgi:peptidoglycan hydrolase CwlO-like protein